jgi:hypothetical protein
MFVVNATGFTAIGHSHKDDHMSVKLLWKWKLQNWKNEIRLKKMLRSMSRLAGNKSSLSPSASPKQSPYSSPHHSPATSPASSPRRGSVVRGEGHNHGGVDGFGSGGLGGIVMSVCD